MHDSQWLVTRALSAREAISRYMHAVEMRGERKKETSETYGYGYIRE